MTTDKELLHLAWEMEQPNQENFEGLDLTKLPIDTVQTKHILKF